MADDLYKSANRDVIYSDKALHQYLESSAGTFCKILSKRGFIIHYLVDNTYIQSLFGMARPLEIFPNWFEFTGFGYICPQYIVLQMMEKQGKRKGDYFIYLPQYIGEARKITDYIVERCHQEGRHYILLDSDYEEATFKKSIKEGEKPGVITIFRNEAPVKGSNIKVSCMNQGGISLAQKLDVENFS